MAIFGKKQFKLSNIVRWYAIVLGTLVVLAFATGAVMVANPHFISHFTTATLNAPCDSVSVCFKEAGLGKNVNIDYEVTATATATYNCVNNGGKCPNAANKVTVNGPVTETATFNSGKNGSIKACIHLTPPGPGDFTCPPGQNLMLSDISFSGLMITDVTNSVSTTPSAGTLTDVCFVCP